MWPCELVQILKLVHQAEDFSQPISRAIVHIAVVRRDRAGLSVLKLGCYTARSANISTVTLLEAVDSLQLPESSAVSFINIFSVQTYYIAVFTIALLLPVMDPQLPAEVRSGTRRFWPDQIRTLQTRPSLRQQVRDLHGSQTVGNLALVYIRDSVNNTYRIQEDSIGLWIVKTHAGSDEERAAWMGSVINFEGRRPIYSA